MSVVERLPVEVMTLQVTEDELYQKPPVGPKEFLDAEDDDDNDQ